MIIDINKKSRF